MSLPLYNHGFYDFIFFQGRKPPNVGVVTLTVLFSVTCFWRCGIHFIDETKIYLPATCNKIIPTRIKCISLSSYRVIQTIRIHNGIPKRCSGTGLHFPDQRRHILHNLIIRHDTLAHLRHAYISRYASKPGRYQTLRKLASCWQFLRIILNSMAIVGQL